MTTWELLTIGLAAYAACATFAAGCIWWERGFWRQEAEQMQSDLHRTQADLGDARAERDQWERRCAGMESKRVA